MIKVGRQDGRVFIEVDGEFLAMTPAEARRVLAGLMGVVPSAERVAGEHS